MNIGIVTTWFERGAAYVSRLYRDSLAPTHKVFIYARAGESKAIGDPKWDDGSVWWGKDIETPFAGTAFSKADFKKWIDKNGIQVVLFNEQHWWPPIQWCREWGVRTVAYVDYYTETTIPLFRHYDALICNTKRHYEAFSWHPGAYYIPWGTDIDLFKPEKLDSLVGGTHPAFFHSCGVSPKRKGTDIAIKAFAESQVSAKLTVHTQVDLAKHLPELSKIISTLQEQGRLEIRQGTITAPGLFHLGDIYLYPTTLEGIGLTLAESIACGLVPVATGCPPMSEFVNESYGRLIPVERLYCREDGYYWPKAQCSVAELAKIIANLEANPDEVLLMRKKAREYAEAHLDWKKNSAEVSGIFQKIGERTQQASGDYSDIKSFENRGVRKLNRILLPLSSLIGPIKRTLT